MSKINAFKCDVCSADKKEVNHWFIGFSGDGSLSIVVWDAVVANLKNASHICGLECASKWTQQQLNKLIENDKETENKNGN